MAVSLRVLEGKHKGLVINLPVRSQFMIGRDPKCHLRPVSTDVSRYHCVIARRTGLAHVCDLQSSNGTFINDKPITGTVRLCDGDILRVGPLKFHYQVDDKPDSVLPGSSSWLAEVPEAAEEEVLDPSMSTAICLPALNPSAVDDDSTPPESRPVNDVAAMPGDSLRDSVRRKKT